jgi:hypothetical protein
MTRRCTMIAAGLLMLLTIPHTIWGDGPPGDNHKARQTRPIPLGVSGGNVKDKTSQFCCSGTLGALVSKQTLLGTLFFILSNNHVLARVNAGAFGDDIDQPGLIDTKPNACQVISGDLVADLFKKVPISLSTTASNKVDAAIARIRGGQVDAKGTILDIGVPASTPLAPSLNLGVKKSGRTTGLTGGTVAALNVTVNVQYPVSCGSNQVNTARFVGQISISPGAFSAGGDSGSLIVENVATNPRPVGLLFAGSSTNTFANVITDVLSALGGVKIVGGVAPAAEEESSAEALTARHPAVAAAIAVQERHEEALLQIPGVLGVGVGLAPGGASVAIEVYLERETPEAAQAIPAVLDGLPVQTVVTGPITARYCVVTPSAE